MLQYPKGPTVILHTHGVMTNEAAPIACMVADGGWTPLGGSQIRRTGDIHVDYHSFSSTPGAWGTMTLKKRGRCILRKYPTCAWSTWSPWTRKGRRTSRTWGEMRPCDSSRVIQGYVWEREREREREDIDNKLTHLYMRIIACVWIHVCVCVCLCLCLSECVCLKVREVVRVSGRCTLNIGEGHFNLEQWRACLLHASQSSVHPSIICTNLQCDCVHSQTLTHDVSIASVLWRMSLKRHS